MRNLNRTTASSCYFTHVCHVFLTLLSILADEERDCSGPEESSASSKTRETKIPRLQEHSEEPTGQTENRPQNSGESSTSSSVFFSPKHFITALLLFYPFPFTSHPLSFQTAACSDPVVQRRHLERSDLQNFSIKDLNALSTSLSQAIQGTQLLHTQ